LKSYQQGDIFSFGVILWEIITRKIPWQDFSFEDIEYAIRFFYFTSNSNKIIIIIIQN